MGCPPCRDAFGIKFDSNQKGVPLDDSRFFNPSSASPQQQLTLRISQDLFPIPIAHARQPGVSDTLCVEFIHLNRHQNGSRDPKTDGWTWRWDAPYVEGRKPGAKVILQVKVILAFLPTKDEHSLEDYSVYFAGVYSQLILRFHVELPGCMFKLMLLQRGDWGGGKNVSFMTLPESNKFRPRKCKSTIFRLLFSIKSTIVLGTLLWSLWLPSSFRWKIQFQRFENHRLLRTCLLNLETKFGGHPKTAGNFPRTAGRHRFLVFSRV